MNICFFCKFNGGGTERATALLAKELSQNNNVFMLSTAKSKPYFDIGKTAFCYLNYTSLTDEILQLRRWIKHNNIDVFVSLEALSGIVSIPAVKTTRCKLIIWEHANYFQDQGSQKTNKLRKLGLLFSDAYVLLTKRDMKNFKTHFGLIKTNLCQIYNIAELRSNHNYLPCSKKIVSVGHINKIKNFKIIPEMAKNVFDKHPDWTWEIYGDAANKQEFNLLKNKIDEYKLNNNVFLRGYELNSDKIYGDAAIYVMTSLYEGYPMVLLEAKSYSLPIISFNIETGPDEIIDNGKNGFLVDAYNAEQMTDFINRLIEDDELRFSFSSNSKARLDNSDKQVITKQWESLFNSVIGRR